MTSDEILKCLSVIRVAYPAFHAKQTEQDAMATAQLWHGIFKDYDYETVGLAVKKVIVTKADYPPTIADIVKAVKDIQAEALQLPSDEELFNKFLSACRNGYYGAKEEYAKLPPVVQRFVGNPNQLRVYAQMDEQQILTSVRSNFLRSVKAMKESADIQDLLPSGYKDRIENKEYKFLLK